ncbi:cytochrome P450 [Methylobacterium sp. 092160098-2]|uniref:cytochrome P450 n=1 Tax=Methylobacterium sp. 092160098-2 TaxID=3025129 RepID=UPI002381C58A|nr:cytochrome P450 [Methylobacterium sp. 092160098-2]MDE4915189.1 cytochrome P450 [Methylobacterium sp. 092160098-2]
MHHDREADRIVLTRAVDVVAALTDSNLSSNPFNGRPTAYGRRGFSEVDRAHLSMLFLDDPDHARLRRLVVQAFSARAVDVLRPRVEAIAATLLDTFEPSEPFDLIIAYAGPLPCLIIAAILGIEDAEVEQFRSWSESSVTILAPERTDAEKNAHIAARDGLNDCFRRMIAERRHPPRQDLIGALVATEAEGDRLTDLELLNTCRLLFIAGNVTITDLIGNGVITLLQHPEQLARMIAEPDLWPAAIEEILRYDTPVPATGRQAVAASTIRSCPVEAGQTVTTMLLAANHDPAQHADSHTLDIGREHQKHHSFGGGKHFCLGASLARLEAQVALPALFYRFPRLRLAAKHEVRRKASPGFNGYEAVWVKTA